MKNNIEKEIAKAKNSLIAKASKKGIYENFGQKELSNIREKIDFYDNSEENRKIINSYEIFYNWCIRYNGR